jgi:membrane fusion protein (multidrug efflux system)
VSPRPVLYYDKYPATTEALSQVDLRPEVTGYITGIFFIEGSHVIKGRKLYEIDRRLYQASYDEAAANVQVAQGNLVQAQQDADRYQYLNEHNAVAKQVLDHAIITLQNAKNQVKAADETLKTAATNLTYSTIYAPFNGTIGFSQVKMGNLVTASTTILNTISTDDPMAVDFLINESALDHYQALDNHRVRRPDSLFTIVMPSQAAYPYPGKISVIDRAVDAQTGAIRIRLVFPNPNYQLRAGMSCVVRVHNLETKPQLVVPSKAVVEQMGEFFLFVARDTVFSRADSSSNKTDTAAQTPKLRAFQVKVIQGATIGPNVIIESGISAGDQIVVDGVQALHEGSIISAGKGGRGAPGQGSARTNSSDSSKKN